MLYSLKLSKRGSNSFSFRKDVNCTEIYDTGYEVLKENKKNSI